LAALHHYHIIRLAVEEMSHRLKGTEREELLEKMKKEIQE
jgi:hypothetical protein